MGRRIVHRPPKKPAASPEKKTDAASANSSAVIGYLLAVSLAARRAGRVHQRVESRGGTCGPVRKRSASTRVKLWPVPSRRMRGRRVMRRPLCGFGQQEYRSDEEAESTKCREGVGRGQVNYASCRGDDIGGNGRDPEGDASGKVDGCDPPLEAAARSARQTTADLDVREIARDEEARRSERVGSPDQLVVPWLLEPRLHRPEGVPVEQQRADELEHTAPPVDPSRLEGEQVEPLPVPAAARSTVGIEGLEALERGRRGEQDRADEEHHPVDARPDELDEPRERGDQEAAGPDGEEDPNPPRRPLRSPPDALVLWRDAREPRRMLAMRPRRPQRGAAVGPAKGEVGGERPD